MPVNEFVIPVVLQKIYAMLDHRGRNQTINGIADGDTVAPEFAVNGCAQFKGGTVVFKINQILKLPLGGGELFSVADALQHFGEHKTAAAQILAVVDALRQPLRLRRVAPVEKINPDGGVNQDPHAVRVRRMAFKSPVQ